MPYSTVDDLPDRVKSNIPSKRGKELFMNVVNSSLGAGKSETVAFASAWGALQDAGFQQNDKGQWVKKEASSSLLGALREMIFGKSRELSKPADVRLHGNILKRDEEQRVVWGIATMITKNGETVFDDEGDSITAEEMVHATTEFMQDVRVAKAMHEGDQVGDVVHSFPLTNELAEAFGISSDWEGWIIAQKIHDDETWQKVKSGDLGAFSIGGKALRERIDETE